MAERPIHAPRAGWPILVSVVLLSSVGCGVHYCQRQGADAQDFQQDSQICVTEAKVQFRGPEDVADFDNPPSPTAGLGAAHNDAATAAACRQPRVSRPAGVVCRGR